MNAHAASARNIPKGRDAVTVRLIFSVCFVPSLVHVAIARCVRGRATNQSILQEAKAAAYTCVSFAFMG